MRLCFICNYDYETKVIDIAHRISMLKWQWAGHISRRTDNRWGKRVLEWRPRLGKRSVGGQMEWQFAQDGWQELDASSRRSSEMARHWRCLCPAVECNRLMMIVIMIIMRLSQLIHKLLRWHVTNTFSQVFCSKSTASNRNFVQREISWRLYKLHESVKRPIHENEIQIRTWLRLVSALRSGRFAYCVLKFLNTLDSCDWITVNGNFHRINKYQFVLSLSWKWQLSFVMACVLSRPWPLYVSPILQYVY
jgi:hypothetical protein